MLTQKDSLTLSGVASTLGYDTRSLRSALVMRAVDAFNPFKREREFAWTGPGGHLLDRRAGRFVYSSPAHRRPGERRPSPRNRGARRAPARAPRASVERCGWDVMPFDNALEDFFKNPRALALGSFVRQNALRPADRAASVDRSHRECGQRAGDQTGRGENARGPDDPRRPQPDRFSACRTSSRKTSTRIANAWRSISAAGSIFRLPGNCAVRAIADLAGNGGCLPNDSGTMEELAAPEFSRLA